MSLQILYEDRWLLAINKPSGIVVETNPFEKTSIQAQAQAYIESQSTKPFLGIIHRLDRGTSGVLLLAKRKQALKDLNRQFEAKTIQKTYLALTHSTPAEPEGELRHWLFKDQAQKQAVLFSQKRARTARVHLSYRTLPHDGPYTLLEVKPSTGKFHQIRAQLSTIGCPIVGDKKYGSPIALPWGTIGLHAASLSFQNPLTETQQLVEAPQPERFSV